MELPRIIEETESVEGSSLFNPRNLLVLFQSVLNSNKEANLTGYIVRCHDCFLTEFVADGFQLSKITF